MNTKIFYTADYYTVKRIIEEQNFIDKLNNTDLIVLLSPSINNIVEQLYLKITQDKFDIEPSNLMENSADIDGKLVELLVDDKLFKTFNEDPDSQSLFSIAFSKLLRKIFLKDGHNDQMNFLQYYIQYWIEDNLAYSIAKDERFSSYDTVIKLLDQLEMLTHFYNTFQRQLSTDFINKHSNTWINVENNTDNILEGIRTFDKDYFKDYESQIQKYKDYSPWKYIYESTRFSDHAMLSDEYSFKNLVLFDKNISLWLKFWDNLKFPILQSLPFHYISHPKDILCIAKELNIQKTSLITSPKHLSCILLKNLFSNSLNTQQNLSFYEDEIRIKSLGSYEKNDQIIEKGKEVFNEWSKKKESIYIETINCLEEILSIEEIEEWYLSYKPKASAKGDYNTIYNKEIEILSSAFTPYIKSIPIGTQIKNSGTNFNLQKLVVIVNQVDDKIDKESIEELLMNFTRFISSDSFYWDGTFSPEYFPALKAIGKLLSLSAEPVKRAKKLIQHFKVNHEGWNVPDIDYKLTMKESFIFCGIILLLEHNDSLSEIENRTAYFHSILDEVISQTRYSNINKDNDYKLPLLLMYLTVNQFYTDLKEAYEIKLITGLDNINTIIEILSNNDYELSTMSVPLLKMKIDKEFIFKKRKYLQRGQISEITRFEESIKRLGIQI